MEAACLLDNLKVHTEESFGCIEVWLLLWSCLLTVIDLGYRTGVTALVVSKARSHITNTFGWYQRDTRLTCMNQNASSHK